MKMWISRDLILLSVKKLPAYSNTTESFSLEILLQPFSLPNFWYLFHDCMKHCKSILILLSHQSANKIQGEWNVRKYLEKWKYNHLTIWKQQMLFFEWQVKVLVDSFTI